MGREPLLEAAGSTAEGENIALPEVGDDMDRELQLETTGSTAEPVCDLFDELHDEAAGAIAESLGR